MSVKLQQVQRKYRLRKKTSILTSKFDILRFKMVSMMFMGFSYDKMVQ